VTDHPFLALKKLLGDGSFYYSLNFDLTDRLQNRYSQYPGLGDIWLTMYQSGEIRGIRYRHSR